MNGVPVLFIVGKGRDSVLTRASIGMDGGSLYRDLSRHRRRSLAGQAFASKAASLIGWASDAQIECENGYSKKLGRDSGR